MFFLLNNSKNLDPPCKTDLDFWKNCFRRTELHKTGVHISGNFGNINSRLISE